MAGASSTGGSNVSQAERLEDLERENARLRRVVSDLTLDKLILQEAVRGTSKAPHAAASAWRRSARACDLRTSCLQGPGPAALQATSPTAGAGRCGRYG